MTSVQRKVLLAAAACELLVTVFPPWIRTMPLDMDSGVVLVEQRAGYHFILSPPTVGASKKIDFDRLFLSWVAVGLAAAIVLLVSSRPAGEPHKKEAPR